MVKYFTLEGLEKLKKELKQLKTVERKKIAEKLNYAASFGDLKENAAYDEARDAQGFLEGRILELEDIIRQAEIIKKKSSGKVQIGSVVLVSSNKQKEKFQIVGPEEVDVLGGKISHQSPLGKLLLEKVKGDKVIIKTLDNEIEYKILKVE